MNDQTTTAAESKTGTARICQPKNPRSCVKRQIPTNCDCSHADGDKGENQHNDARLHQSPPYRPQSMCFGFWGEEKPGCAECIDRLECRKVVEAERRRLESMPLEERVLTEFMPNAADEMKFYRLKLTPEQRGELLDVVNIYTDRRPMLSECCTPLNAPWIFAAVDSAIGKLRAALPGDPDTLYPFIMSLHFDFVSLSSPATFAAVLGNRINAIYDTMPEILNEIQYSAVFIMQASREGKQIASFKAEAIQQAAAAMTTEPEDRLISQIAL